MSLQFLGHFLVNLCRKWKLKETTCKSFPYLMVPSAGAWQLPVLCVAFLRATQRLRWWIYLLSCTVTLTDDTSLNIETLQRPKSISFPIYLPSLKVYFWLHLYQRVRREYVQQNYCTTSWLNTYLFHIYI